MTHSEQFFRNDMPNLFCGTEACFDHAVLVVDSQGKLMSCNNAFLETAEYPIEDLLGQSVQDVIGLAADCFKSSKCSTVTVRLSGQRVQTTRCFIASCRSGAGEEFSMVHLFDVRLGQGLSLLQRFADTLMKDINLGVILVDPLFRLIDISDMACRVLGFERQRIVNRPMDEVFASIPMEHRFVQRSLLDGVVVRNHAISWMNNSERYELLLDSNLLKDRKGNVVGAYVIFKDVTNLRSLEEQVQRSDRLAMIGQIAAGTAHEIRNPLTSIKGFMQVLKNTFAENGMEKEQGYTDIMLTEIDRINELVSEFLLLSKRKNVTYDHVDVPIVMKEILPIIINEALLYGVTVHYETTKSAPKIIADRELLKQVFLNICKNGIEAVGEGGTLTITERVDTEERKLNVEIHDTGPGIPSFLIDKIFDPFFTTKENGTGLGLSVCQRIVHDMGGTIRVASKGFGTTFTVSIPIP